MVNAILDKLAGNTLPEIMLYVHIYNIYFSSAMLIVFTVHLVSLYECIVTEVLT